MIPILTTARVLRNYFSPPNDRRYFLELMAGLLALVLLGCNSKPVTKGVHYVCTVPPPADSTLSKNNGSVGLTDTTGNKSWCRAVNDNSQTLCSKACTDGKFSNNVDCQKVKAIESSLSYFFVWDSDLKKGSNACTQGTIIGPGEIKLRCDLGPCFWDTMYGCLYTNEPSTCNFGLESTNPALGTVPFAFDNNIAVTRATPAAAVQSDENANDKGSVDARPGYEALSFNLDAGAMYITSLFIPLNSFAYSGHQFVNGNALLLAPGVVTATMQGNAIYSIPVGQATFRLMALDQNADGYTIIGKNSTPLTISLTDASGPHISGTINGDIDGHPVRAILNTSLIWINRPPIAAAKVPNVSFNSSNWPGARDVTQTCATATGIKQWTWHGVPGAKVNVILDASPSYNPDGGELQYAWNAVPLGSERVAYLSLSAGNYNALLTVQNQYYVSTVNKISFNVRDLANSGAPSECGSKIASYDPHEVIKRIDLKDPVPFQSVITSYATTEGVGLAVNGQTQRQVIELGSTLGQGVGTTIYQNATKPGIGLLQTQPQTQSRRTAIIIIIIVAVVVVVLSIFGYFFFRRS